MNENEQDPLKSLFNGLPQHEPPEGLTSRILSAVRGTEPEPALWALRPALALASLVMVALLGVMTSWSFIAQQERRQAGSSFIRWARTPAHDAQPLQAAFIGGRL